MFLVTKGPEGVSAFTRGNEIHTFGWRLGQVEHLDTFTASQTNQGVAVIGSSIHIRWQVTCGRAPPDGLGRQVDRDQFVAVLHGGIHHGTFTVHPEMARGLPRSNSLCQGEIFSIPTIDIDMVQTICHRDEPLHVGRKSKLVGIQCLIDNPLNLRSARINECQRVAQRIGNDQRLLVRCQVQVMRLFARRNSLGFCPCVCIDDADAGLQRVQHKQRRAFGSYRGSGRC